MISSKNNSVSDIKKTFIYLDQTIEDALKIIQFSNFKICNVLDKKDIFKGVLNDGDIRRALLRGKNLKSKINDIYKKNPLIVRENYSENEILKKLDIRGIDEAPIIKNRKVIGIFNNKTSISEESKIPVVIMCGGLGKRLKPITNQIPKALVKINNIPMMSIVINKIKKYGFKKFIFSTYYKSSLIKKFYKSGKSLNINIKYIRENKPLGTAGSLSLIKNEIKEKNFILTNCDVISDINYKNLLDFHIKNKADLTIAVKKFTTENLYGEISLRGINVSKIVEKPKKNIIINSAIYVLNTKCIKILENNQRINMNDLVTKLLDENKKVIAFPFFENWHDLGTKVDLKGFKNSKDLKI
jgi:dTDP-glucose pyrophosphorylase